MKNGYKVHSQLKLFSRNIHLNDSSNKNYKKEERNYLINKGTQKNNNIILKLYDEKSLFKQKLLNKKRAINFKKMNTINIIGEYDNNIIPKKNNLTITTEKLKTYTKKNKMEKEFYINNTNDKNKSMTFQNSNLRSKTFHKKLLLSKLKELLKMLEKREKERKVKKNIKKRQLYLEQISNLFSDRLVEPSIPKLRNRMQMNKYLINNFKENDSNQEYIKRSLRYKKINEDYEVAKTIQTEPRKSIGTNEIKPYNYEKDIKKQLKKKNSSSFYKTIKPKEKGSSFLLTNSINTSNVKRVKFTLGNSKDNKEKQINKKNYIERQNYKFNSSKNIINLRRWHLTTKNLPLYLNKDEKEKNNDSNIQDEISTERPRKNNTKKKTVNFTEKILLIKSNEGNQKYNMQSNKKNLFFFDKFNLSNIMYKTQKKNFNDYLLKKRILRSKNFSVQMYNLSKEREILKSNAEEASNFPKLKESSLIYEMKYKNLLKNSFNPMNNFKEGDEDLGIDDLKKIKKALMETEINMYISLKNEINPKYIKNKFNKTTVGKFHSTKGDYFGLK